MEGIVHENSAGEVSEGRQSHNDRLEKRSTEVRANQAW